MMGRRVPVLVRRTASSERTAAVAALLLVLAITAEPVAAAGPTTAAVGAPRKSTRGSTRPARRALQTVCSLRRSRAAAVPPCLSAQVFAAVAECRAESVDFICPVSQATHGWIGAWDVSAVASFNGLFENDAVFNVDISTWNTGACTNLDSMFKGAASFDQDISAWDVSQVTTFAQMFRESRFNRPLGAWSVLYTKQTDDSSMENDDSSVEK